jgi:hypothetical protein
MCLPPTQVDRFYGLWFPLLKFVNAQLKVVPNLAGEGPKDTIDIKNAVKVRDALWKNDALLDLFVAENTAQLLPEDLNNLKGWKYRRQGNFIIFKALKKHAIFISERRPFDVFAVRGLYTPFEEIFGPYLPAVVETVLLPYDGEIITDGLYSSYNLTLGSGIQRELKEVYDNAKEREEIITTLLPQQPLASLKEKITKVQKTNAKVLEAFQKNLYKSGLSPKIVDRDISVIAGFAQAILIQPLAPGTLLNFGEVELQDYFMALRELRQKQTGVSFKRFIHFLRNSGRMEWDETENMLDIFRHIT